MGEGGRRRRALAAGDDVGRREGERVGDGGSFATERNGKLKMMMKYLYFFFFNLGKITIYYPKVYS